MNARSAAAWTLGALTIALASANPVYRGLVLLCALNVLAAHRRPQARLRPLLAALGVAGVIATAVTLLASHTGEHTIFTLPAAIPVAGGRVTLEALVFGFDTALGIAAAVSAAAVLTAVLESHELVDAMPSPLARSGAAVATALNLIPGLARSSAEIRDAQRMRGWRPARVRGWPDLAVPVVLTALEGSMSLAEAMEARGYGSGPRTHYAPAGWTAGEVVVAVLAVAAAAVFLALRATGAAADWYPFPALTAPPTSAAAVACCVALAAPVVAWQRRP